MASCSDSLKSKEKFFDDNKLYSEIELTDESKPIGKLHEFDMLENEIWLLQCPRGMAVAELQNQKLKIPGRTNINNSEAVCMEFNEGFQQRAFAFCDNKRRYDLRLLPVRGTIIVRDRLKALPTVTEERTEECCPPAKKVPVPASIRVRHPLLGVDYKDKSELNESIAGRLQEADKISAQLLKQNLWQTNQTISGLGSKKPNGREYLESSLIKIEDDDDIDFVTEEKVRKKRGTKREHKKSNGELQVCSDTSKNNKKKYENCDVNKEYIAKDLQWLKNI